MDPAVRFFVPVAVRAVVQRLASSLDAAAGRPVDLIVDLNPAIAARIGAGEAFDIGMTNPPHLGGLVAAGLVDGGSMRAFGVIPLAIGRRAGNSGPVLTGADEIAALLRRARSIGYTGAGTSGRTFLETMARMGLSGAVAQKSRAMGAGGPVAAVVAQEIEFAVVPLTTILSSQGVEPAAIFSDSPGANIELTIFLGPRSGVDATSVRDMLLGREIDAELLAAGVRRVEGG